MPFKEVVKCTVLKCEISILDAITHSCAGPVDEDDECPTNMWRMIGDVGCDTLT